MFSWLLYLCIKRFFWASNETEKFKSGLFFYLFFCESVIIILDLVFNKRWGKTKKKDYVIMCCMFLGTKHIYNHVFVWFILLIGTLNENWTTKNGKRNETASHWKRKWIKKRLMIDICIFFSWRRVIELSCYFL